MKCHTGAMQDETAPSLAVFCDYENVAIGVREAKYPSFDIELVVARLLDKGKIVVKKAYCDWTRYKSDKRSLHEASFELIDIPHVSYSGKNSADIRLVVDALDLCHTKSHVDVFVIISGDSDFSPLVSKLRENNKMVIGLGVKNSSSDLFMENCDEFIYYDDLERTRQDARKTKPQKGTKSQGGRSKSSSKSTKSDSNKTSTKNGGSKEEALELVLDTVEALFREREGNLWGSMVKQTLKRKRPSFSEGYYGYRTFNQLLEDAQQQKMLDLQRDEKSGGYIVQGFGPKA